jgi:hypothetical protein
MEQRRAYGNNQSGDHCGYELREFSTWTPQLLSGIGNLPATVRDRSMEIELIRKRAD